MNVQKLRNQSLTGQTLFAAFSMFYKQVEMTKKKKFLMLCEMDAVWKWEEAEEVRLVWFKGGFIKPNLSTNQADQALLNTHTHTHSAM